MVFVEAKAYRAKAYIYNNNYYLLEDIFVFSFLSLFIL